MTDSDLADTKEKETLRAAVIIPAHNHPDRLASLLEALTCQDVACDWQTIVVDDGSSDDLSTVVNRFANVQYLKQALAGPSAARNLGARSVKVDILVFIDQDCIPQPQWLRKMLEPFENPEVVGSKGVYTTDQQSPVARFVQAEYEEKFSLLAEKQMMNFVDGFSAAFRQQAFMDCGGFDITFPFPSVEDREFCFRLSQGRPCFKYCGEAVVSHLHSDSISGYCRKKFKYGYWGVEVMRRFPALFIGDDHTPNSQRFQLICISLLPVALLPLLFGSPWLFAIWSIAFLLSGIPLMRRSCSHGILVCMIAPFLIFLRVGALLSGLVYGTVQGIYKHGLGFFKNSKSAEIPPAGNQ